VHDGAKAAWNVKFKNHATSSATPPGNVPPITPPASDTNHNTPPQPLDYPSRATSMMAHTGSDITLVLLVSMSALSVGLIIKKRAYQAM
jgi:hypothetical protein